MRWFWTMMSFFFLMAHAINRWKGTEARDMDWWTATLVVSGTITAVYVSYRVWKSYQ